MELVSIIVPVYKAEAWIEQCIKSCLEQTYNNLELILVIDGDEDLSGRICDDYAKRDGRVKVIHQDNQGVSCARNEGIKQARGKFVLFVDSDDFVDKEYVEVLLESQRNQQYDLVISGYNTVNNGSCKAVHPYLIDTSSNKELLKYVANRQSFRMFRSVWGKLFFADIIKDNYISFRKGLKYGEDYCFVLDYIQHASSCVSVYRALYNYRLNSYDKSSHYQVNDAEYQWGNGLEIHKVFKETFIRTGTYEAKKALVDAFLLYRIKLFLNNMTSQNVEKEKIVSVIRSIRFTEFGTDIKQLSISDAEDVQEKAILCCIKAERWSLLFYIFHFKNKLLRRKNA